MNGFRKSRQSGLGQDIRVSFEFFPPKSDEMANRLWSTIERLQPLQPDFVSVTYGAGGSTRERTVGTVGRILKDSTLSPAAHLTCVAATKNEVDAVIHQLRDLGVRRFVALRGDDPAGAGVAFKPTPGGYQSSVDLVAGLKAIDPEFDITVSAYPEKHPDSPDMHTDIDMLKRKVDAGATRAITQFFFDNDVFERYLERVRRAGISIPIVPGILPVYDFAKVANFARACKAHVPAWLEDRFRGLESDVETRNLVAAAVVAEQVFDLVERGLSDFHFYTMNRPELVYAICHLIGIRPRETVATLAA
ncbi:MAG: methylenetetrahydrofolate reductase [NAD(P)H] [Rhizobiaceae bacterium]|jgi:methylenetetrahydrofolate reductase (NADPH)|nr:methylenetetrahydrofolate reductase [NAD(P)H] [Rhizobiaceae bacterium]